MKRWLVMIPCAVVSALCGCGTIGEPQRSFTGLGPPDKAFAESLRSKLEGEWWLVVPDEREPRRVMISLDLRDEWNVGVKEGDEWHGYGVNTIERDGIVLFDLRDLKQERFSQFSVPTYLFGALDISEKSAVAQVVERIAPSDAMNYPIKDLVFHEFAAGMERRTAVRPFDPNNEDEVVRFNDLDSHLITSGTGAAIQEFVLKSCKDQQFLEMPIILTREPFRTQAVWSPAEIRAALAAHDPWLGEKIDAIRAASGAQR